MSDGSTKSRIREEVLRVKHWLQEGRSKLLRQHQEGSPGIQVCARLTDLLDTCILELFEAGLSIYGSRQEIARSQVALVPYGGYGRREMAPYSDVDLMLLFSPKAEQELKALAQRLVQDLSDVGVDLGFSFRAPQQAIELSRKDAVVYTSLVDSRFLGGSVRLYTQFVESFARMTRRNGHALVGMVAEARQAERAKYGETIYLLEPNVKRSRGGLRDLQMFRWIGFARYGVRELEHLQRSGLLTGEEYRTLRKAQDFLLQLRNELHFGAKSGQDVLHRSDQMRLAELLEFPGREGQSPVEEFMQRYFSYTSSVHQILQNVVDDASWRYPRLRRWLGLMTSHRVGREFRVGPAYISATRTGLSSLQNNLSEVLRLMELSGRYNCRIDQPTWQTIRLAMHKRSEHSIDEPTAKRFLSFLSQTNGLGNQLRQLHELGVLGQLIPGFEHARCLLQFNEYHKYTVDEHSIRAVEQANEFGQQADSVLGQAYRDIKSKGLLHLALLVHDLGKGFTEDHSEVGARIALDVAKTLSLNPRDTETLRFLVHRHLMLSHLAFRRDTSDESIVLQHAVEIGSPSVLRMLYVLTCADLAAVGPGVLNQWKDDVLAQLYLRMQDHLSGGVNTAGISRVADKKLRILQDPRCLEDAWFHNQVTRLPAAYLDGVSHEAILDDLTRLRRLPHDQADAWGRYIPEREVVEYTVGVYEDRTSGIFHRLAGALTGQGLEILSAEIHSLADRLCLDRFYVLDNDFRGEPTPERYATVCAALIKSLQAPPGTPPTFRRTWQAKARQDSAPLTNLPAQVRVDNTTSDHCTIIDVFAHDHPGLLYKIARTLFELGLSVTTARIGTHLDQVVDVFYVVDQSGRKVEDEQRIEQIRESLLGVIPQSLEDLYLTTSSDARTAGTPQARS